MHDRPLAVHTLLMTVSAVASAASVTTPSGAATMFAPSGTRPSMSMLPQAALVLAASPAGDLKGPAGAVASAAAAALCALGNRDGDTPLHLAARWGFPALASLLVTYGSPIAPRNRRGETPAQVRPASFRPPGRV
jgi:hypothetical protein